MAKFEIHGNISSGFWARFVSNNEKIVWWTEKYTSKQNAKEAIEFLKVNASDASIVDLA